MNLILLGFQVAFIYLLSGFLFGIFFILIGVDWLDPDVKGSGWKFRLLILPGTIILWPFLVYKLFKVKIS